MSPYKQLKQVFHSHQHGEKIAKEQHELRLSSPATVTWDFNVGVPPLVCRAYERGRGSD